MVDPNDDINSQPAMKGEYDEVADLRTRLTTVNKLAAARYEKLGRLFGERNRLKNIVEDREERIVTLETTLRSVLKTIKPNVSKTFHDKAERILNDGV